MVNVPVLMKPPRSAKPPAAVGGEDLPTSTPGALAGQRGSVEVPQGLRFLRAGEHEGQQLSNK